jgi:hypothetical protein
MIGLSQPDGPAQPLRRELAIEELGQAAPFLLAVDVGVFDVVEHGEDAPLVHDQVGGRHREFDRRRRCFLGPLPGQHLRGHLLVDEDHLTLLKSLPGHESLGGFGAAEAEPGRVLARRDVGEEIAQVNGLVALDLARSDGLEGPLANAVALAEADLLDGAGGALDLDGQEVDGERIEPGDDKTLLVRRVLHLDDGGDGLPEHVAGLHRQPAGDAVNGLAPRAGLRRLLGERLLLGLAGGRAGDRHAKPKQAHTRETGQTSHDHLR